MFQESDEGPLPGVILDGEQCVPNAAAEENSRKSFGLEQYRMWEGWNAYHDSIELGPGHSIAIERPKQEDPEVVGFAYPLPPVPFQLKNERRHPPPKDEEMFHDAYIMLTSLDNMPADNRVRIWRRAYDKINSNRRDSPRFQTNFLKAGCIPRLLEAWRTSPASGLAAEEPSGTGVGPGVVRGVLEVMEPFEETREEDETYTERYWVIAILGRMMGTHKESREQLIKAGMVSCVLEGCRDSDPEVQECSVCAIKGLIYHPEGRQVVTYDTLMECLTRAVRTSET